MCKGWIQWWQSRTVSAAPVAVWTSSAGEVRTTSTGPFSQCLCDCPTSGPGRWWCPGTWMTPLQSQCCSWWWVGESRGVSPEVHDHIHSFECVKLHVVKTAPDSQLLNLLSVSRLVTVLDEVDQYGVICKLQEHDRGVFICAVVCVEGKEQWGENTSPRSSSADHTHAGCVYPQPHYLLPVCQEAGDPLTDSGGHRELS